MRLSNDRSQRGVGARSAAPPCWADARVLPRWRPRAVDLEALAPKTTFVAGTKLSEQGFGRRIYDFLLYYYAAYIIILLCRLYSPPQPRCRRSSVGKTGQRADQAASQVSIR